LCREIRTGEQSFAAANRAVRTSRFSQHRMTSPNQFFPCPVCGYLTFDEPPGSYDICGVCGWEDDALQLEFATSLAGGANKSTLADAQLTFYRAADRLMRKKGIAALPPPRDPAWRPIDPVRDRFPKWTDDQAKCAPTKDETLYYWRDTYWNRGSI
jgi:hypothetical protein